MNASQPRFFDMFIGCEEGAWAVEAIHSIVGETLPSARFVDVRPSGLALVAQGTRWILHGGTSNERYVSRSEKTSLAEKAARLERPGASRAALIPIRKSSAWWALAQDERRDIFEEHSKHISTGLQYLPAIARRLYHCRDIDGQPPFDFLTWFEFTPEHESAFNDLLAFLRASLEWQFVEREVDIRLSAASGRA